MSGKDGGPAFPGRHLKEAPNTSIDPSKAGQMFQLVEQSGMTLRDYFAAQALTMFSDPVVLAALRDEARAHKESESGLFAKAVYEVADAMLKERAK